VDRLELGNAGDHAACRDGVWEMRIDQGPGYRVYIAKDGNAIVLLLGGGIKDTQQRDIERAVSAWNDYKRRRCA
jgi:putative addiction module killer protein